MIDDINKTFKTIYKDFSWSMEQTESRSGAGSTIDFTWNFRKVLLDTIKQKQIKTILDCSCGDWNWMKLLSDFLPNYTGIDCVEEAIDNNNIKYSNEKIKFICSDMNSYMNNLTESYDLIIIRHTLEHLPLEYVIESVKLAKQYSKYMLITSFSENIINYDLNFPKETYRPLYLESEPFLQILGSPIESYYDGPELRVSNLNYPKINLYENN